MPLVGFNELPKLFLMVRFPAHGVDVPANPSAPFSLAHQCMCYENTLLKFL